MTDQELINRFESGKVPESGFHHADHVRLAFAYLRSYPVLPALEKFSAALKQFAARHGKTMLYNETITYAYTFLIAERRARCGAREHDWDHFAEQNPDLLVWKNGILTRYYEDATLKSDLARRTFILPDKRG
ncbi:MAG: hypothetical protein ACRD3P_14350 [Terriglobales bacterium]